MNRLAIATSVLALCGSSFAQTYVTSPSGHLSSEGSLYGYYFGALQDGRYQFFEGDFRNQLMVMKEIAYRNDYRTHTTTTAVARSWKNVTLKCAECDYSKLGTLSSIFSLNATNTPTTVFNGSVTWAGMTGLPGSSPAKWDKRFPFSTAYVHTGTADLLLDYDFTGGKLGNSMDWSNGRFALYYLDGYRTGSFGVGQQTYHGPFSTTGGCVDGGATRTYGAYNYFYFYAYGPNFPTTSFRNKFRIYSYSYYAGPNKPVIHAYSVGGNANGTNFPGVTCQKLFINPATIFMTAGKTSNASGHSGVIYPTGTASGLVPYLAAAVGVKLFTQAAWADTRNNALKFTRAVSLDVPGIPGVVRRSVVFQGIGALKQYYGRGPYDFWYYNPLLRICK